MFFDETENEEKGRESPPVFEVRDKRRFLRLSDPAQSFTPAADDGESKRLPTYVEELQEKLRASESRIEAFQEKFQQARDELHREAGELRARLAREYDRRLEQAKVELLTGILEGIDNLERTASAAEAGADLSAVAEGVKATYTAFFRRLSECGLEEVPADGSKFDPQVHEAVETAEVEVDRDGAVLATLQKGYRLGEKLVRPARVKVGRGSRRKEQKAE